MEIQSSVITLLTGLIWSLIPASGSESNNTNIYAHTQAGMLSPAVKDALYRVYVPNGKDGTVSIIDPSTYQVISSFKTGKYPQHVVPSYDLQTLWVLNNASNSVTPIDPKTMVAGKNISVSDPYNLYFTQDGQYAIVVCESKHELEFRNPKTMDLSFSVPINCKGANHMEFSPNGDYAIVTCEFSGQLMKFDMVNHKVIGYLSLSDKKTTPNFNSTVANQIDILTNGQIKITPDTNTLPAESMPQDIRSNADGSIFYVADMLKDGLVLINPNQFTRIGFIPTGIGTHGIYPSRNGRYLYVSNRGCHHMSCGPHGPGNVTVVDPKQNTVIATWSIPQGGSPDMGDVTPDGKELWLAGRYDKEVYVFDTTTGILTHRIPVGSGPHGLAVWPQPGRFSLGHTGNMR